MNMIRSIRLFAVLSLFLSSLLPVPLLSSREIQVRSEVSEEKTSELRALLAKVKGEEFISSLDWTKYGDTVISILFVEKDVSFITELFDWLVKGIPDYNWEEPAIRFQRFLMDTENCPDRADIRLKVLDLLLYKAKVEDFSKPPFTRYLFDEMKPIRDRMIEVLKEDGEQESVNELQKAMDFAKTRSEDGSDELELKQIQQAIKVIDDRVKWHINHPIPDVTEIRQQYNQVVQLLPTGIPIDSNPPGFYDGCKYIIDRWPRFKWGARYFVESSEESEMMKSRFVYRVLSKVHQRDWDEAVPLILMVYNGLLGIDEQKNCSESMKESRKGSIISHVVRRNPLSDLEGFSILLYSNDPSDNSARMQLLYGYRDLGTTNSIPELKKASVYWREKGQIGLAQIIDNAILAIEQRTTQTPQSTAMVPSDFKPVKSLIERSKCSRFAIDLNWSEHGKMVIAILQSETDQNFIRDMSNRLLARISDDKWNEPARHLTQFMKDTEFNTDRSEIRLIVLDLLLYKAHYDDYSKSDFLEYLFDNMQIVRNRMLEVLKEDGTSEALPELNRALDFFESKTSHLSGSYDEEIDKVKSVIGVITDREQWLRSGKAPGDEEIQNQYRKITQILPDSIKSSGIFYPGKIDGGKYIIDRWERLRWGVRYLLESKETSEKFKASLVLQVLCKVQPEDWEEAFPLITEFYDNVTGLGIGDGTPEIKDILKSFIVRDVCKRADYWELDGFSRLLYSNDPSDNRARMELLYGYRDIGTTNSIPELKKASAYWREKDRIGLAQNIDKAILAIEQRITQTPQPVATCEPHAGLLIIE